MEEPTPHLSLAWLIGIAVAICAPLFTFLLGIKRGKIDESTMILSKWKELVDTHERQIKTMGEELTSLRDRLHKAEDKISAQAEKIIRLEEENAGLRRAIAQTSDSSAIVLGNHVSSDLARRAREARRRATQADEDDDESH